MVRNKWTSNDHTGSFERCSNSVTSDNYLITPFFNWKNETYDIYKIPTKSTNPLDDDVSEMNVLESQRTLNCFFIQDYGKKHYKTWKEGVDLGSLSSLIKDLYDLENELCFLKDGISSASEKKDAQSLKRQEERKLKIAALRSSLATAMKKLDIEEEIPENRAQMEKFATTLLQRFAISKDSTLFGFPLLFSYESYGDDFKWNILFFLTRHSSLG